MVATETRLAVTVAEAAEMLGVSVAAAYIWIREGRLPAVKVGGGKNGRVLVPVARLEALLNGEPGEREKDGR